MTSIDALSFKGLAVNIISSHLLQNVKIPLQNSTSSACIPCGQDLTFEGTTDKIIEINYVKIHVGLYGEEFMLASMVKYPRRRPEFLPDMVPMTQW